MAFPLHTVQQLVPHDTDGLLQAVKHKPVRVEPLLAKPKQHGSTGIKRGIAALKHPAGPAGGRRLLCHGHPQPALCQKAGRRKARKPGAHHNGTVSFICRATHGLAPHSVLPALL
ncbi:hypothetical protein SDC9_197585 [bioreactor metagenome]|uniref:Uncharacterized protein n=1 Tax=bioreactor metagenome TaxID=1076179 RepID=A0A645IF66_9ZZZZ